MDWYYRIMILLLAFDGLVNGIRLSRIEKAVKGAR